MRRETYDELIAEKVNESILSARDTLNKASLSPHDLERIVFVGGPTNYKPLRDKVSFELGIPGNTDVNPMTAVAEGACLFAESIDWSSLNRSRKNTRGRLSSAGKGLELTFNYIARTPDVKAKIAVQLSGQATSGSEFQVDSLDTGWTSGRHPLTHGTTIDVSLTKTGNNSFKVFVFDSMGGPMPLEQDQIVITRTTATVDAIPASHSISVAALDKIGGPQILEYLVKAGDSLPKKGNKIFKAGESLKAGSNGSLNFALWEGEIENPITDNRAIGVLKIAGSDFDDGVIPAGATLECDYEILDSGNIIIEISVPCIGGTFHSGKNFYSRQEGQLDYTKAAKMVIDEANSTLGRIDEINDVIDNSKLEHARQKLESAVSLDPDETETEKSQEAMEKVLDARRLLAQVRKEHLKDIRQIDLDNVKSFFEEYVRQFSRPSEVTAFDNLAKTTQNLISNNDNNFENNLDLMKGKNFEILWRQDWFVVERFKWMASSPHRFADKQNFEELVQLGQQFMRTDDIGQLRSIVAQLSMIQIGNNDNEMLYVANIIRG